MLQAAGAPVRGLRIRCLLDWAFEGPAALFTAPLAAGHFASEGLDVSLHPGQGSSDAVRRVAQGEFDLAVADLATLMEHWNAHPDQTGLPVAVMIVYNQTPCAVFALKTANIKSPAHLPGRTLGAPSGDAGRGAFSIFARANGFDARTVNWRSTEPARREAALIRGEVDAITGYYFTCLLNLNARGVKDEDILILPYAQYGVPFYGNAIIASDDFVRRMPQAVQGFLRAFTRGVREVVADPSGAATTLRKHDPMIDLNLENRRLRLALGGSVANAGTRMEGFGEATRSRLTLMTAQVGDAFGHKIRIPASRIFLPTLMPEKAARNLFAK